MFLSAQHVRYQNQDEISAESKKQSCHQQPFHCGKFSWCCLIAICRLLAVSDTNEYKTITEFQCKVRTSEWMRKHSGRPTDSFRVSGHFSLTAFTVTELTSVAVRPETNPFTLTTTGNTPVIFLYPWTPVALTIQWSTHAHFAPLALLKMQLISSSVYALLLAI